MDSEKILLGHGSGGLLTHGLIKDFILKELNNPYLKKLTDAATLNLKNKKIAFTTDSYVIKPIFFPGSDIGKLAICGTVNDLVAMGARPLYLSLGLIIEEGFPKSNFKKIIKSIKQISKKINLDIVTGDIKVVEKGACDKIFINTSGVGEILEGCNLSTDKITSGDKIIISGFIGEHGISVFLKRENIDFKFKIKSDCNNLDKLILPALKKFKGIKFMRDPTRGGLATTLNEITINTNLGIEIVEEKVPIRPSVKAMCDILGMESMYLANEGKMVLVVGKNIAKDVTNFLRKNNLGKNAQIIGTVTKNNPKKVCLKTKIGGLRILDMLSADPLPRIC